MPLRRIRGAILRLARRRAFAVVVGTMMAVPAAWLEFSGGSAIWWIDGLVLLIGATGAALIWAGLTGARPDWVD